MRPATLLTLVGLTLLLSPTTESQTLVREKPRAANRLGSPPEAALAADQEKKAEAWRNRFSGEPRSKRERRARGGFQGRLEEATPAKAGSSLPAIAVGADCEWSSDFVFGGLDGPVYAQTVFDDGAGEALYVGGEFGTAGGVAASFIAKWDGTTWSALGSGMDDIVWALGVFDDGMGEALYAGGDFTTAGGVAASFIAKWDGNAWSPVGTGVNDTVFALTVFDDGMGEALYAGGFFTLAGGAGAGIAEWDGSSWSSVGGGVDLFVFALTVFDDGMGAALYAGGYFSLAGTVPADNIAKWDGMSWSALGAGTNEEVDALAVFDDGGGPALYAGGYFTTAGLVGADYVARWKDNSWSPLASGTSYAVWALTVFDDGTGEALFAGGAFPFAAGALVYGIAKWDGSLWSSLASGMDAPVQSLFVFDDGTGEALFAGGYFFDASGSAASFLASWDGTAWSAVLNSGPGFQGMDDVVLAMTLFNDGGGTALYAGGWFYNAGGVPVYGVAKWDGTGWSPLGEGMSCLTEIVIPMVAAPSSKGLPIPEGCEFPSVEALAVFDDGTGPALYAGGEFDFAGGVEAFNVAKWDGTSWSALGVGTDAVVEALAVFDDGMGEALYAGGEFLSAGGAPASRIAKWAGGNWSPLGSGLNSDVETLAVFDDGGGDVLYAGGEFDTAGGMTAMYIARWDGVAWSDLGMGMGMDNEVETLYVYDDGGGPDLYAGGQFDTAGGMAAPSIARWNGSAWSAVGAGMSSSFSFRTVDALVAYDTAPGTTELYAGGFFDMADGVAAMNVARWDGAMWTPVLPGTDEEVEAMEVFDDGGGPALYLGGFFNEAGGFRSDYVGRLRCPLLDFGDAPDPSFPTLLATDGARHAVVPGFYLGSGVDAGLDGLPDAAAAGDDNDGNDDEDGVTLGILNMGASTSAAVVASAAGTLDAWFDWDGDGDWSDPNEKVFDGQALTAGVNNLMVAVPADAAFGATFARFRFSTAGVADPTGRAADGEVEDYAVTVDDGPPSVTLVDSTTGTGDGTLDECEEARVEVTRLHVTFDQAVRDPAGDAAADDVTNPANYRVFAAGPDHDLSSTACGPAVGDDVAVPIGSVTYASASKTATLELAGGLTDGPHRLVVCGTIADVPGNTLAGGDFSRTFRVERRNLFVNGNLDCDLGAWTATSTNPAEIVHDGADVDGAGVSGSVGITNLTSSTTFSFGQCVAASAGTSYDLRGSVRTASAGGSLFLARRCEFFAAPGCAGSALPSVLDVYPLVDSAGSWEEIASSFFAPASTASMLCRFDVDAPAGSAFTVHLDALELTVSDLIFADGFESGDASAWSAVTP